MEEAATPPAEEVETRADKAPTYLPGAQEDIH